ncbi:MAG: DNA polymerase IV [Peptococcaceae bacterium]|jgi:DNA polymerase-4|nr:DNA polymerase IV [Peptococcaceae bacterium]
MDDNTKTSWQRTILHCDCNAFFASVEETFSPELKLVPMAIAGDEENRHGIILAKNELAKKYRIQTAETVWSAKRKCPDLVLRPPRRQAYGEFCKRVNAIYEEYTDRVERFGMDESFLDLTGSLRRFEGDADRAANELRERVKTEIGITISVGVSWNKVFAKLGSDYQKPDAVTLINRDNWREIVWPLPASDLFLVGRKTAEKLQGYNIRTIGDIAYTSRASLAQWLGRLGEQLYINANGLDESPVALAGEDEAAKSIGNSMTFRRDLVTDSDIHTGLVMIADSVAARLRRSGVKCRTVQITMKDTSLKSITRQTTLAAPTFVSSELVSVATGLIAKHWQRGKPIRMLGITGENLIPADEAEGGQMSFFDEPDEVRNERAEKLELAIDGIRGKFGKHALQRAVMFENDLLMVDGRNVKSCERTEK